MKFIVAFLTTFALLASAQEKQAGVLGEWQEPSGSVIRIAMCGQEVCARLVFISPHAPEMMDVHNPDQSLRKRPLCGLEIGRGFHLAGPDHAEGGSLYDPKSGKTYHGEMTRSGDHLDLRGYVGIKLFGRSETWSRPTGVVSSCVTR